MGLVSLHGSLEMEKLLQLWSQGCGGTGKRDITWAALEMKPGATEEERGWPLEARKSKEMDSPLQPLERNTVC